MATDKLNPPVTPDKLTSRAMDLFELVQGCSDLTLAQINRIVRALLVAGYSRPDGP